MSVPRCFICGKVNYDYVKKDNVKSSLNSELTMPCNECLEDMTRVTEEEADTRSFNSKDLFDDLEKSFNNMFIKKV